MLRLGVAQIDNHFSYDKNLKSILNAIQIHAANSSDLVLFPECAVTGFNTAMLKIDFEAVLHSVREARLQASQSKIWLALPTPWRREDGKFTNAVLVIDDEGAIRHTFHKIGFQKGEDKAFVPGAPHTRSFDLKGYRIGTLICIETTHGPWDYLKPHDRADVILWPGFYGVTPGISWSDSQTSDDRKIRENLSHWKVPLIQATCASSQESHLWPDKDFGGSPVLDCTGREVYAARPLVEDHLSIEMDRNGIRGVRSLVFEQYWKAARNL